VSIRVYNTMIRAKEELVPREAGKITMYVCGPTVYNYIHIGNARTFLNFDMIRRYLERRGYEVTFAQNITDVDDKIINKAKEQGVPPEALAEKYRVAFEEDMAALGVKPPDIAPRATKHVADMLEVVKRLVDSGYAYASEGDVYFEVDKFEGYGNLSRRALDEQQHIPTGGPEVERKRGSWDFALWKAAKPGEPSWDSPWGPGRPGWHIECSTMSMKYLEEGFDIHGGGLDLVFPHHENEIAQAEAYSGGRFARYWMHSGMLNIDLEKMSKSLGNIKALRDVLAEHDAATVRMLMLGTHYRSQLNFSDESLNDARASLERISNCRFNLEDVISRSEGAKEDTARIDRENTLVDYLKDARLKFLEHMDDDFNSAAALGVLFEVIRETNTYTSEAGAAGVFCSRHILMECQKTIDEMCAYVGLFQQSPVVTTTPAVDAGPTREELIDLLLQVRQAARDMKSFQLSDRVRDGLADLGVRVEDVEDGYRWRFER